jgi:hypothetical protein
MTTAAKLATLVTEAEITRHKAHIIASAQIHIEGQLSGVYCGENDPQAAIRNIQAQATRIGMPEVNAIADKAVAEIKNYVGFK